MTPELRVRFRQSLRFAESHSSLGEYELAFAHLETAHILGQQFLIPHVMVHLRMLRIGLARRDNREVSGQMVRLMATLPGFILGWVPLGNTGGANVSAIKPMPVPEALSGLVPRQDTLRAVSVRLAALIFMIVLLQVF